MSAQTMSASASTARAFPFAKAIAAGSLAALLTACGGGGGGTTSLSQDDLNRIRQDPRVMKLDGIGKISNSLMMSGIHAININTNDKIVENFSCSGAVCRSSLGSTITLNELINQILDDLSVSEVTLGSRYKFDASTARVSTFNKVFDANISGIQYTLWGDYGYAALASAYYKFDSGADARAQFAAAVGQAANTNPTGAGSATWRGIVDALPIQYSANTAATEPKPQQGSVTLTINDPNQQFPTIGASIVLDGGYGDISLPSWASMPLTNGHFSADGDRFVGSTRSMEGKFYGPNHEEAYGVFDNGNWLGSFGAKRN